MRKLILLLAVLLLAGQAGAKTMTWHGTTILKLGAYPPDGMILDPGSGVATVNNSSGGPHMSTLRIQGDGVPDSGVWVVTDPETTPQIKSIIVTGTMQSATMTGISGATHGGPHELAMAGFTRVCLFLPGCITNIAMQNTKNNGNTGVGVGGIITMGGLGSIRISVEGAPWEIHTVTQINQTKKGNFLTLSRAGWVHGAGSATD